MSVVLHLHVYLADIVAAFADGLDGKFLESHLALDDSLQGVDGSVDRTVTACRRFKFLAADVEPEAGNRFDAYAACHLQIVDFDAVTCCAVCAGEYQDIVVVDIFLLVGKFKELLLNLV